MSVAELAQVGAGLGVLAVAVAAYIGAKTYNTRHRAPGQTTDGPGAEQTEERKQ